MSPHPNETPHERTGTADPADSDRRGPVARRDRATLDTPAGWPSPVGTGISTAVAARVTGRWTGAKFESLLEHVEDCAVFVLDRHGHVRTWNDRAEAVTGYASEGIVGEHVSVLYPDAEVEAGTPERQLRSAAEEDGLDSEGWRVRVDGSAFRAETTIRPLREGDELTGFVNVTRDVAAERDERELRERCERLEDLIAATSHDLRGPLTVAAGHASMAAETGETDHLDAVAGALDRAEELLDCLTTLAEKGERIREADPIELREVAEAAWDVTGTDGAALCIEEEAVFPADRCRTQQLLENLFKNAVEHGSTSPRSRAHEDADGARRASARDARGDAVEHGATDGEEGSAGDGNGVTVHVGSLPDGSGFYVADDGPGIPEGEREQVFESGYSTVENGTGFGLAIVRTIAEAHGWSVDLLESEAGGARFEFSTRPG
jgi:PAS domain S-box-containing protein